MLYLLKVVMVLVAKTRRPSWHSSPQIVTTSDLEIVADLIGHQVLTQVARAMPGFRIVQNVAHQGSPTTMTGPESRLIWIVLRFSASESFRHTHKGCENSSVNDCLWLPAAATEEGTKPGLRWNAHWGFGSGVRFACASLRQIKQGAIFRMVRFRQLTD